MTTPFSLQERQELLDRYFPAYRRWQDLDYKLAVAGTYFTTGSCEGI